MVHKLLTKLSQMIYEIDNIGIKKVGIIELMYAPVFTLVYISQISGITLEENLFNAYFIDFVGIFCYIFSVSVFFLSQGITDEVSISVKILLVIVFLLDFT